MKQTEQIEHTGIVTEIKDKELKVNILQASACAKCSISGACGVSEDNEKVINIHSIKASDYRQGEKVNVFYRRSLGFRALFLGYLLPFLILLTSLIILTTITQNEGLSGLVSLGLLIPYYLILYFTKDRIKKTFAFSIEKIKAI
jgi:sigma-E factor negative regulatory protein RseC